MRTYNLSLYSRSIEVFRHWRDEEWLDLSPPYQRGDVWGPTRQGNLIKSFVIGIPIPSFIINDRFGAGWGEKYTVIDGKQRITTFLNFLDGKLTVEGSLFGLKGEVSFNDLPPAYQRSFKSNPVQVAEGALKSLEEEKEVFELVNFGGVPQGETDFPVDN